jgi:hypothetical protein
LTYFHHSLIHFHHFPLSTQALDVVFQSADLDHSGLMDEAEWASFVLEKKLGPSKLQAARIFKRLGTVGEGVLTIDIAHLAEMLHNPSHKKQQKRNERRQSAFRRTTVTRAISDAISGLNDEGSPSEGNIVKSPSLLNRLRKMSATATTAIPSTIPKPEERKLSALEERKHSLVTMTAIPRSKTRAKNRLDPLPCVNSPIVTLPQVQTISVINGSRAVREIGGEQFAKSEEWRVQQEVQHQQQLEKMNEQMSKMDEQRAEQQVQHQQQLEKMEQQHQQKLEREEQQHQQQLEKMDQFLQAIAGLAPGAK